VILPRRRVLHDRVRDVPIGDDVLALLHGNRGDRRHRLDGGDVDLRELLDERQDGVELAPEVLHLLIGNRNARQMGDAADGLGIDGHGRPHQGGREPKDVRRIAERPFAAQLARLPGPGRTDRPRPPVAAAGGAHDIDDMNAMMDEIASSARPTFANRTPLRIGAVELAVRDLDRTLAFYRDEIGLEPIDQGADHARLGAGGAAFLTLHHRPDVRPDDRRSAGLFHTAFLMPTRADLARFLLHIWRRRTPVSGVADHLVSEAIYLDDPEGNGVEVYCDRPPDTWRREGELIVLPTDPLDLDDLAQAAGTGEFGGAPAGLRIGHVHLRVGDAAAAERFYHDILGFDVTWRTRGAAFLSSGGYHHHLAANAWSSRGAGRRDDDRAGLARVAIDAASEAYETVTRRIDEAGLARAQDGGVRDPWGTRLHFTKA